MQRKKISMDNLYKFYQEFCDKQVQTGQYIPEYYEWLRWYKPVPQQLWTPSIIQEELKSKVSHSERSTPPPYPPLYCLILLIPPISWAAPLYWVPPISPYILKYAPHSTWVNLSSMVCPFLCHVNMGWYRLLSPLVTSCSLYLLYQVPPQWGEQCSSHH